MSTASAHAHYTGILKCSRMEEQKQKYNLGWPYVILCRFTAVHNKVRQDLITNWDMLAIHKLKLNFAWYFCVSAVCTIVFTNSHSAGRASNMYRQYMYSQLIHFMPRGFKMAISKHLPEQPYLLSQCQYCSRWRRPTHGK